VHILAVSTYELGHQPHHLALATAALTARGHTVQPIDLAVDQWRTTLLVDVDAIVVAVPMHTAMRLALDVVGSIRRERPQIPVAMFGLYAIEDMAPDGVARFAGEFLEPLTEWADAIARDTHPVDLAAAVRTASPRTLIPLRDTLPGLDNYARLSHEGDERTAGYVEASTGCRHRCRHCPVPVIYDGRVSIADPDTVLADITQQVEAGAAHITFGDPDFLNAPVHSRRVVAAMHDRHPDVTFDATVKVEHILDRPQIWAEFAAANCLFVVSAFEILNDDILARLDKGHSAADIARAVDLLRDHGIEIRPSWLPFTPWTSIVDIVDVFRFIASNDLIPNTDPVQLAIRLLIPKGSLLAGSDDASDWLGDFDADRLSYTWVSSDAAVDDLQRRLHVLAESHNHDDPVATFQRMWNEVAARADIDPESITIPAGAALARPRLMENWFC
jgi:radical SAM superfamily enzyme YgiQ (UPF0313 family)